MGTIIFKIPLFMFNLRKNYPFKVQYKVRICRELSQTYFFLQILLFNIIIKYT